MSSGISSALSHAGGQVSLNYVFLCCLFLFAWHGGAMEVHDVSWKGCGDFSEVLNGQEEVDRGLGRFISMAAGTDIAEECSVLMSFCPDSSS